MLELEEEIDIYRYRQEKRGHLKLVRLESGADTAAKRGTVPQRCRAPQGSAAITTGLGLDGCNWLTAAPSQEKAAAVFLGDILKHLVFCQSFPAHVGKCFCASHPWLCLSICPRQKWFPFCSVMEEPKAALWK